MENVSTCNAIVEPLLRCTLNKGHSAFNSVVFACRTMAVQYTLMREKHTLSGFSTNPTELDDGKCSFLWFPIPEVSMIGYQFLNDVSTSEHGIEFNHTGMV